MTNITDFEYMVWCNDTWQKVEYKLYKLNEEKTLWLSQEEPTKGWEIATTKRYTNVFTFFHTEEEAKEHIRVKMWESKNGEEPPVGEEDFSCPCCSRRFQGKEVFTEYGGADEREYKVVCLCGTTISVEPCVYVTYTVKTA